MAKKEIRTKLEKAKKEYERTWTNIEPFAKKPIVADCNGRTIWESFQNNLSTEDEDST